MESNIFIITREELYKEIWEISLTGVAKKYDLNYSKLASVVKNIIFHIQHLHIGLKRKWD